MTDQIPGTPTATTTTTTAPTPAPTSGEPPVTPSTNAAPPTEGTTPSGQAPPALTFSEGVPQVVQEFAKSQGFNQAQLDSTVKFFNDTITQANQRAVEESYQRGKAHVESWGPNAKANIDLAKRALQVTDTNGEVTKYLKESGAANHPVVMNFLVGLGKMLQEGGFIRTNMTTPEGQKTLADKLFSSHTK